MYLKNSLPAAILTQASKLQLNSMSKQATISGMAPGIGDKQTASKPSPWGDFFISYEPQPLQRSEEWMVVRADKLKDVVRELFKTCNNTIARMSLVDALQQLGIAHHFEYQIDAALIEILDKEFSSSNLHEVSLRFRLLREHGHWISPAVFQKFQDENGSFNMDITNDPKGLLSLYNAAHLLVHGEQTLEEAITFARHHLKLMCGSLKFPLLKQVKRAIHMALPRTCKRVETLDYISEYDSEEEHNPILLELAKLDFNMLQHIHLKELKAITEWWNHFSGYVKLSYVRGRIVECHTWAYVVYHEKGFQLPRIIIAKMIVIITMLDDTYDIHATIEECRMLHQAIQRWDESAASILPLYLKKFYKELLRTFKDIEGEIPFNVNYDISFLKKAIQDHVAGYLQEAEWSHTNHKPLFKEQVNLTCQTIGAPTLSVSVIAGMDDTPMKPALEWAAGLPDVVVSVGKIVRFMNDIAAFKRRKCKGDAASSVECYINEHNVTSEVAIERIDALIEDQWRTLNQARFENHVLLPATQRIISLALSASLFYDNRNDVYTLSEHLRKTIEKFFIKPM